MRLLRYGTVGLRARQAADVAVLHSELYDDVETRVAGDSRPWQPVAVEAGSVFAVAPPTDSAATFSVVDLRDGPAGELAGEALLWDIDTHQRTAHLGLALRPSFRGQGLGAATVSALCHYGFLVRGMHRLQLETLASNLPMQRAAAGVGFVLEGRLRAAAFVLGAHEDQLVYGLLDEEWRARHG